MRLIGYKNWAVLTTLVFTHGHCAAAIRKYMNCYSFTNPEVMKG